MGTGAIHFDSEKGQAAAVVVCIEAPPRGRHSCLHCRGRKHGRTLLNMCGNFDINSTMLCAVLKRCCGSAVAVLCMCPC